MYFGAEALKADKRLYPVSESIVNIDSVVYTEYLNRKSMLESCTDDSQKPLIEAQCDILLEVSIKDLFTRFKKFVKKALLSLVEQLEKLFMKGKKTKFKNKILTLLNKAKKLLDDIEEAETKEKVEEINKEREDVEDDLKDLNDEIRSYANTLAKTAESISDPGLREIYRDFASSVNTTVGKMDSTKTKEDLQKIVDELNDLKDNVEERKNKYATDEVMKIFKRKLKDDIDKAKGGEG